jgi:hypothetical protein
MGLCEQLVFKFECPLRIVERDEICYFSQIDFRPALTAAFCARVETSRLSVLPRDISFALFESVLVT